MEHHLQQEVSQFFFEVDVALDVRGPARSLEGKGVYGVKRLVRFLEQVAAQRVVGLLAVPRAIVSQPGVGPDQSGPAGSLDIDDEGDPQPTWLVHAGDLQKDDVIYFTPATIDFQWLDTSGRRFEIAYDDKGSRLGIPRRPYLPNEFEILRKIWDTFSGHLTTTQIHVLR